MSDQTKVEIEVLAGAAGHCLVVNGARIAGPKPLGGGRVVHRWDCDIDEILRSLPHEEERE